MVCIDCRRYHVTILSTFILMISSPVRRTSPCSPPVGIFCPKLKSYESLSLSLFESQVPNSHGVVGSHFLLPYTSSRSRVDKTIYQPNHQFFKPFLTQCLALLHVHVQQAYFVPNPNLISSSIQFSEVPRPKQPCRCWSRFFPMAISETKCRQNHITKAIKLYFKLFAIQDSHFSMYFLVSEFCSHNHIT